jgi:hypothetical protein
MHIISVDFQPTMRMNIHNQCLDFKLTNRKQFNAFIRWNEHLDDEVDTGSMTNANFIPSLTKFGGATMYELQRKRTESDDQLKSTYTLLFSLGNLKVIKSFMSWYN